MATNRLEVILAARTEQFDQAVRKMQAEARSAGANVSRSLESAGDGANAIGKAAGESAKALGRAGKQGAEAFDEVGQEAEEAARDVQGSAQTMERAMRALQKEASELRRDLERVGDSSDEIHQLKQQLKQLEDQLEDTGGAAKAINFQTALESGQAILSKLQELTSSFSDVAEQSRSMRRAIEQAVPDPKRAEEFTKKAKELKDEFGDLISEEDIGKAVQRIETLKGGVDDLERSVRLAVSSGKEVEDAAQDLSEILASLSSGNADFDVIGESLRTNFGIAATALREYGAEVDENGKIVAETVEQQLKAQAAVKAYIDENERFANIASRNKDAQAKMSDEYGKFQRTVGESIDQVKEFLAQALLPLLQKLNESPETFKKVTAGIILLLTPLIALGKILGSVAGFFGQLVSQADKAVGALKRAKDVAGGLGTRLTGAGGTMKNFATTTGASALALLGLGKAAYDSAVASAEHLDSVEKLDDAQTALIQTLSKAIREEEGILKIRKLSTDQIAEQAKAFEAYAERKIFLTLAIVEASDALEAAEKSGDEAAIKQARERLQNVFNQRKEVQASHKQRMDQIEAETKAQEQSFISASSAYRKFKVDYERGLFQSKEIALNSLRAIADGLSDESKQNALADIRKLSQEVLKEKLDRLQKEVEAEKVSVEAAKRIQAGLLRTYGANLDQRREASDKLVDIEKKNAEKRLQNEEKLQQQKLQLEKSAIQQRAALASNSPELASLERRLAAGEDVVDQIKAEAQAQTEKLKGYVEEEAAIERIAIAREKASAIKADKSNADQIAEQAAEKLRQLNERVAADKDRLDSELADKQRGFDEQRIKLQEKAAKDRETQLKAEADQVVKTAELRKQVLEEEQASQREGFEERRRQLQALADAGQDVSNQQQQLAKDEVKAQEEAIKKRLELQKQEIEAKRSQADVGADPGEKELNAKRATLELERAQRQAREELQTLIDQDSEKLRAQTKELEKQRDVLKEQNEERKKAAGFKIDTSFGASDSATDFGEGFGQRRDKRTEDGQSVEDLDRQIARNRVKLAENQDRTREVTSSPLQPSQVQLDPNVVSIFQQMLSAIQQTAQNTRVNAQAASSSQNTNATFNSGEMFARGRGGVPQ